jgi:Cu/Ag efflux protein CusF
MNQHPLVATVALIALLSPPAWAQPGAEGQVTVQSSPGKATMARTRSVVATVTEVDAPGRKVTLKGPAGAVLELKLGPDVRNLAQLQAGDRVRVRYQESLSLTLKKEGTQPPTMTRDTDSSRAEPGQLPGGEASDQIEVTADVIAVNAARQTVTLRGPSQTVDLRMDDREQWKRVKVGDQVHAVYRQAMAVSVERLPARK